MCTGKDMPKSQADKPPRFEYCDVHHSHRKDQYCSDHRTLQCMLCVPIHHKNCYVEDVECAAKSILSSDIDLLYETVHDFQTHLLSAESRIQSNVRDIRLQKIKILSVIQEIYDKMKWKIDKLFQDIVSDLETKCQCQSSILASDHKSIKDVTENLNSSLDEIGALKGSTIDTKVFLKIQDVMKSIDKCRMDVSTLNQTTTRKILCFFPDKTMNNFLSTSFTMGTISLEDSNHEPTISVPEIIFPVSSTKTAQPSAAGHLSPGNTKGFSEVKAQICSKYNIRLKDDTKDCWITGLVITLDGRRLLADGNNNKIKMFSRDMKIISFLSLPAPPLRIAVSGDNGAVVSVADKSKLFILDVSDKQMSIRRIVDLSFEVWAITTYKDKLVVTSVATSPPSVKLTDQVGKIYWSTSTDHHGQKLFSRPRYVTCYDDGKSSSVAVTDMSNNTLTLLDSCTGDVISRCQVERKWPSGITTGAADKIYVCYFGTSEVAVLSKDLSGEKILLTRGDGISERPQEIAYDAENHQLLVSYSRSSSSCNFIDCFQLL